MKSFKIIFSLVLVLVFSSCKKEVDSNQTNTDNAPIEKGTLKFHLHTYVSDLEVDAYGIDYPMATGRTLSLGLAQLYISDIELVKLDGSVVKCSSNGVLKVFESETVTIGDALVGNYQKIRFKVGLLPNVNKLDPTTSGYATLLHQPEMWFESTAQPSGYVFMNFSGEIDTTKTQSGVKVPFEYKIGTDKNLVQVEMPQKNFSVMKDIVNYLHIKIDYSLFFDGIDLTNNSNLHVKSVLDNELPIVNQLKNNIPKMFIYE